MTHNEAKIFLEDLAGVIRESKMGPQTQDFTIGLINTVLWYLPQAFVLLPAELEKEDA
jgi:hypothetical protein